MPTPRFLTLDDVAEILNVSWSQAYALVRRKELIAIQIGGRGAWRIEVDELERFIQQKYAEARAGTVPEAAPDGDGPDGPDGPDGDPTGADPTGAEQAAGEADSATPGQPHRATGSRRRRS
jgi:excisionase family DNA binding protein